MIDLKNIPRRSGIYRITNTKNGKVYIGQSVDVYTRLQSHCRSLSAGYHCNSHLQRAWDKYGHDAFTADILEFCNADELYEREIYYIAQYNTFGGDGYNLTKGGDGTAGVIKSEEAMQRIIQAKYKSVVLLNTGEVFESIKLAAKTYGLQRKSISNCCAGVSKSGGILNGQKMVWVYYNDYLLMSEQDIAQRIINAKYNQTNTQNVCLVNTGEVFISITSAGDKYGVDYASICACCNGKRHYAGKYNGEKLVWKYLNDMEGVA